MPALNTPIITLALENLQKLTEQSEISTIWNVFTKCKDNLENGHRLENLTWRLWYRSCHSQKQDSIQSLEGYSKTFQETSILNERKIAGSLPSVKRDPPVSPVVAKESIRPHVHFATVESITNVPSSLQVQPSVIPTTLKTPFVPPSTSASLSKPQPQFVVPKPQPAKPNLKQPISQQNQQKPKFYISREESDPSDSDLSELDSDYDSETDSLFSDGPIEYPPQNLFKKSQLHPLKRPSLLSVAIQRNQYRNNVMSPKCFEIGVDVNEAEVVMKEVWHPPNPTKTSTNVMYEKYDVDTFNIW